MGKVKAFNFMCIILVLILVSACSAGGGKDSSSAASGQDLKKAVAKEPIELYFYFTSTDWNKEGYFMKEYGDLIKQKFPYITPIFLPTTSGSLSKLVTANQRIDIIISSIGKSFQIFQNELQSDMEPQIAKYKFDLNRFEATSIQMIKQMGGGKISGIPWSTFPAAIYYNKDIFDKFGVPYPKNGLNWDDLYEMSKKLTRNDNGTQYYGLLISPSHYLMRSQRSLNLVDPQSLKVAMNTDQVRSQMENIIRFFKIPGYNLSKTQLSVGGQRDLFIKERLGAMWLPVSTMHTADELAGMNWDLAAYPTLKDAPGVGAQVYPNFLYTSSTSKYKDDAFEIISYLTSDEFQMKKSKEGSLIPLIKNDAILHAFGQDSAMYKGKNIEAMLPVNPALPSPQNEYYATAASELGTGAFAEVVLGTKDINTAMRDAEEAVIKKIEADKIK
jgi:ABC-type glycerol-3-phosphate transport system substrate-binding protein